MSRLVNRRIRLLLATLIIAFAGLLLRAMWLQGVRAASLSRLGETQHLEEAALPASRGTIFDRMGVGLALGVQATRVYGVRRQIRNPHAVALVAGRGPGLDPAALEAELADRTRGFVHLVGHVDP